MTSIADPNMSDRFTSAMEEIHNKQLKTYGEIIDATTELCQSHRQFVKSALGMFELLFAVVVTLAITTLPGVHFQIVNNVCTSTSHGKQ